ncbi:actin-related protein 2/3 complex subunit 5-like [Tropilaelaps mercedesae]|uniref:Actin-related protein 2/3 complex subunit 5 n=1 Tax=Tropilaelaps mercedesae TaxID=418985 RepID=A0A1V9XC80_9ACAR|nr:actin-related protein 2/3 complex subunit 5-like [Tropilaelaps mercedesae]
MATNTLSSAFRKLDIDQYNEDLFVDESGGESAELVQVPGPDEAEVNALLNGYPFFAADTQQHKKDKAFALAMKCMLAIRISEMDAVISTLEPELVDTLMKYIYRGFESPAEGSSGHLLAWHEKVFTQGGLGCIIRVMTARKSV